MELQKKTGGFAFCILAPETRSATNTRYHLERKWMFQRNVLLMQNITLFMRIVTLTFSLLSRKRRALRRKQIAKEVFFAYVTLNLFCLTFCFHLKNPNKILWFLYLFNNLSEISWRPDWAVEGNPGEISQKSSYWVFSSMSQKNPLTVTWCGAQVKQTLGIAYLMKGSIQSKTALCLNLLTSFRKSYYPVILSGMNLPPHFFLHFLRDNKYTGMLRKLLGGFEGVPACSSQRTLVITAPLWL